MALEVSKDVCTKGVPSNDKGSCILLIKNEFSPQEMFSGKSMTCRLDNNLPFFDSYQKAIEITKTCTGSLYDVQVQAGIRGKIKAIVAGFRVEAELFFLDHYDQTGGSYVDVCNLDYLKVYLLRETLIPEFTCQDSKDEWILYVKMAGGGLFCSDATHFVGDIKNAPTGFYCQ